MDGSIADTDPTPTVGPEELPEAESSVRKQSREARNLEMGIISEKRNQCQEGVVLRRTRRATAAARGDTYKTGSVGALALCSIRRDAGVTDDTAAAEAMELQSILAMQALLMK